MNRSISTIFGNIIPLILIAVALGSIGYPADDALRATGKLACPTTLPKSLRCCDLRSTNWEYRPVRWTGQPTSFWQRLNNTTSDPLDAFVEAARTLVPVIEELVPQSAQDVTIGRR